MKTLYRLYEFLFDRWKIEIVKRGIETWTRNGAFLYSAIPDSEFQRDFVEL